MSGKYLTVQQTWDVVEGLAWAYEPWTEVIPLPESTVNGHQPLVLRFRPGYDPEHPNPRRGILLMGNIHGEEWGGTDILMSFCDQVMLWYCDNWLGRYSEEAPRPFVDLAFGNKTFPGAYLFGILGSMDLYVLPIVNPDGREYSFQPGVDERGVEKIWWRKNRAPVGPGGFGVDLNRNFDFLWDFRRHFHPDSYGRWGPVSVSDDPSSGVYHGTSPFSEAETSNIRWLLEQYPHIRHVVDLHSCGQLFLTPWGDDEIQTVDPCMSFANPAYDGLRGLPDTFLPDGPAYKDFMAPGDKNRIEDFSQAFVGTVSAVGNRLYEAGPGFTTLYGISGGSKDYFTSRHLADPCQPKADGFLIEWGMSFQPPYEDPPGVDEMTSIITDISAGLCELILQAERLPLLEVAPCMLDFGLVRLGHTAHLPLTIRNEGTTPVNVAELVFQIPDSGNALGFNFTPNTPLAPDATLQVDVTYTPTTPAVARARIMVTFARPGETVTDNRLVDLIGEGCDAPAGNCYAPVFNPLPFIVCLLLMIITPFVIAAMAIGLCLRPGAYCALLRYLYRVTHCTTGNHDPCIRLGAARVRPCFRAVRQVTRESHRPDRGPGRPGHRPPTPHR